MAIQPSSITTQTQATTSPQAIKLVLGQTYQINITQIKGNQVQFNLGGQNFSAETQTPLTKMGHIPVKVLQTTPNVQLAIALPATKTSPLQTVIQNLTRQLLPNQMPVNQAIALLSNPQFQQQLPVNIQAQLQIFINQLFKPTPNLTSQQLKNLIQNSGLFFENNLLKNKSVPQQDIKGKLLQLHKESQSLAQSQASHSLLSATLNKALNKITLQQIQFFENPANLNLHIPLSPDSLFKDMQLDIRKKNSASQHQEYEILLNLNLPQGLSTTKIILNDQDQISLYLWADSPKLLQQIDHNLPSLKMLLTDSNIDIKNILVSKSQPVASHHTQRLSLIDIKI